MKKISALIVLCLIIISICLVYLTKSGISLRSQALISPSVMSEGINTVSAAVASRLFPEFQQAHYVIFGFLPFTDESKKAFEQLQSEYEKTFHSTVQVLEYSENLTPEVYKACQKPCWILTQQQVANQLKANALIDTMIKPLQESFFTLTWMNFSTPVQASDSCIQEKRLDFDCITSVSVQQVARKMKADQRNFFVTSYNETDIFIFVQTAP